MPVLAHGVVGRAEVGEALGEREAALEALLVDREDLVVDGDRVLAGAARDERLRELVEADDGVDLVAPLDVELGELPERRLVARDEVEELLVRPDEPLHVTRLLAVQVLDQEPELGRGLVVAVLRHEELREPLVRVDPHRVDRERGAVGLDRLGRVVRLLAAASEGDPVVERTGRVAEELVDAGDPLREVEAVAEASGLRELVEAERLLVVLLALRLERDLGELDRLEEPERACPHELRELLERLEVGARGRVRDLGRRPEAVHEREEPPVADGRGDLGLREDGDLVEGGEALLHDLPLVGAPRGLHEEGHGREVDLRLEVLEREDRGQGRVARVEARVHVLPGEEVEHALARLEGEGLLDVVLGHEVELDAGLADPLARVLEVVEREVQVGLVELAELEEGASEDDLGRVRLRVLDEPVAEEQVDVASVRENLERPRPALVAERLEDVRYVYDLGLARARPDFRHLGRLPSPLY